jgi:hypothetical protein
MARKNIRKTRRIKRKLSRRAHKRRQTRRIRRRGGNNNMNINDHCQMYRDKLNEFRNRLQDITLNTYEDLSNDVKNMYDEAVRVGCKNEADALELFENEELNPKLDELHNL